MTIPAIAPPESLPFCDELPTGSGAPSESALLFTVIEGVGVAREVVADDEEGRGLGVDVWSGFVSVASSVSSVPVGWAG